MLSRLGGGLGRLGGLGGMLKWLGGFDWLGGLGWLSGLGWLRLSRMRDRLGGLGCCLGWMLRGRCCAEFDRLLQLLLGAQLAGWSDGDSTAGTPPYAFCFGLSRSGSVRCGESDE